MAYKSRGLAGLVVRALRSPAGGDELLMQIEAVRISITSLSFELDALKDALESAEALDAEQADSIQAMIDDIDGLADALTGPAHDPDDNGVCDEVEAVPEAVPSPTADAAAEAVADDDEDDEDA